MFWFTTIALSAAAVVAVAWPLLRRSSNMKVTGLVLLLTIPLAVIVLYRGVGNPEALNEQASGDESFGDLTSNLEARLEESPEHLEGWILLGRSYKSMQQYDRAVTALETAARIDGDSSLVIVELVEARLFASGNARLTPAMVGELEAAVAADPAQQKGLWLLGIAAAQSGNDAAALEWWNRLIDIVEPGSAVATAVGEQITQTQQRLGIAPPAAAAAATQPAPVPATSAAEASDWAGLRIGIDYSGPPPPSGSVLFLIVRQPGVNVGPPIAVRRISEPAFPLQTALNDSHAMQPGTNALSQQQQVEITARLSMQGRAQAVAGDWQSGPAIAEPLQADAVRLNIDSEIN